MIGCGVQVLVVLDDGQRVLPSYTGDTLHPWAAREGVLASARVTEGALPQRGTWLRYTAVFRGGPFVPPPRYLGAAQHKHTPSLRMQGCKARQVTVVAQSGLRQPLG